MPRTPFDKVVPEYRNAIVPQNHWMSVCHPYFIPIQPPPPPCGCPGPHPGPHPGPRPAPPCVPAMDHAPIPCGMHGGHDTRPIVNPAAGRTVVLPVVPMPKQPCCCPVPVPPRPPKPEPHAVTSVTGTGTPVCVQPLVEKPNPYIDPVDYDSNVQAPHPKIYWLAKRDVSVVSGDNTDVEEIVEPATGDKTYVVSSHTPESDMRRIEELERQMAAELAEVRRIKANMLTIDEDQDPENGVRFGLGME